MKFDFAHLRKYLLSRLEAKKAWCFRMSITTVFISVLMGIMFSMCAKLSMLLGAELGLLCAVIMLFIFLLPFLVALFIVEIIRPPEFHVSLLGIIPAPYLFVPDVYLQVPFSPPRFCLA